MGNLITQLVTIFFVIAVFEYETLIKFPLFYLMVEPNKEGIVPLESGLLTCGQIAIVLIGAFPMVKWLEKALQRPLQKLWKTNRYECEWCVRDYWHQWLIILRCLRK